LIITPDILLLPPPFLLLLIWTDVRTVPVVLYQIETIVLLLVCYGI